MDERDLSTRAVICDNLATRVEAGVIQLQDVKKLMRKRVRLILQRRAKARRLFARRNLILGDSWR